MAWKDRVQDLWAAYGQRYDHDFIEGWIYAESGGDNQVAPLDPSLDEVGWFQIAKEERDDLGLDRESIVNDEDYSFRAGITVLDHYAVSVPSVGAGAFTGRGFSGMVKLYHTLPAMAGYVKAYYNGDRSTWLPISDWIKTNKTAIDVYLSRYGNFSSLRLAQATDKVMNYSGNFDLPIFDLFESGGDDSDMGALLFVAVAVGAFFLLERN